MVFAVITAWRLSDSQACGLLALGPEEPLEQARTNPHATLFTEERMYRLSYLLGIYNGLHIHWNDALADEWIQLPNQNPIFGGLSPVEYMIRGGLDAMQCVRRLVDAWCAGN